MSQGGEQTHSVNSVDEHHHGINSATMTLTAGEQTHSVNSKGTKDSQLFRALPSGATDRYGHQCHASTLATPGEQQTHSVNNADGQFHGINDSAPLSDEQIRNLDLNGAGPTNDSPLGVTTSGAAGVLPWVGNPGSAVVTEEDRGGSVSSGVNCPAMAQGAAFHDATGGNSSEGTLSPGSGEQQSPCVGDTLIKRLSDSLSYHLPLCVASDPRMIAPPSTPPRRRDVEDPTGFLTPVSTCSVQTAMSADYLTHPHPWQNFQHYGCEAGNTAVPWSPPFPGHGQWASTQAQPGPTAWCAFQSGPAVGVQHHQLTPTFQPLLLGTHVSTPGHVQSGNSVHFPAGLTMGGPVCTSEGVDLVGTFAPAVYRLMELWGVRLHLRLDVSNRVWCLPVSIGLRFLVSLLVLRLLALLCCFLVSWLVLCLSFLVFFFFFLFTCDAPYDFSACC